ncbi:MFS transporter [Acuticoccus sp. M5D2P5]|uniref:MFS transporter n=1 Tax=Acuticoccus kalidii TaxID=2910977 RepID=UPI001F293692|nr:MFS transporter [Acuticoccus kalidii]MCF3936727.1 MFS transporter [Acuticoccus kalidii]
MSTTSLNPTTPVGNQTALAVLVSLSLCHFLNDTIQSLLPAIYPVLQENYALTFTQIGIIHFVFQVTASLLQPAVGIYTDKRPLFRLSSFGMGASLAGLVILAFATHYWALLVAAMAIGIGSSIFHPDSARVARAASGGRFGFAQSLFQVGGNVGSAVGPLLAAAIVLPFGQSSIAWFSALALVGIVVLWNVGTWARANHLARTKAAAQAPLTEVSGPKRRTVIKIVAVLAMLIFSKYIYLSSLTSYYTFYLIETFDLTVAQSQLMLFLFLAAVAGGTFFGGPVGDRFGRRVVIWVSILGALPFTLALPYANLFWTGVLTVIIGLIIASAFSAILVYAQGLVPGRVGMISGLFFGFAFGLGGIGAAVLGMVADWQGIAFVYHVCSFLPVLGLLTVFLPPEARLRHA